MGLFEQNKAQIFIIIMTEAMDKEKISVGTIIMALTSSIGIIVVVGVFFKYRKVKGLDVEKGLRREFLEN